MRILCEPVNIEFLNYIHVLVHTVRENTKFPISIFLFFSM